MPDSVDLPEIGKVKKTYVYIGVAAVGVLAVMYYRNHQASAALTPVDTTASTADAFPSDGSVGNSSDPNSIDPTTGLTYGDGGSGGVSGGGVTTTTSTADSGPGTFTSNATWAQYAINYLTGEGMDASALTDALGLYINGQPVTAEQEILINDAIGIAGRPPVSGPGNFPPSIHVSGSKTGPGTPTIQAAPGGLSVTPHAKGANFGWSQVSGATVYELLVSGAGGKGTGTSHIDQIISSTHASLSLAKGEYKAQVRGGTPGNVHGHWSAFHNFEVK